MIRTVLFITVVSFFALSTQAQERIGAQGSASGTAEAKAQKSGNSTEVTAGTQLSAELLSTIDASRIKPGETVKLRVIKPVMAEGKRVINKGAMLIGHVAEVTKAEGKQGISRVKLTFDELQNQNLSLPFSATLEQITTARIQSAVDDDLMMRSNGSATSSTRTSAQSGGLLGGVTGTVGNTVGGVTGGLTDTTANTVGGVTGSARQNLGQVIAVSSDTVNQTTGRATGLIAISSETSAQTESSSTLSLTGRNVKIDKGAIFLLKTNKSLAMTANR